MSYDSAQMHLCTDAAGASLSDTKGLPQCRDRFTLHGLWPSYYSRCRGRPYPEGPSCAPQCDCPFEASTLEDLEPQLGEEWPSYMGSNGEFWWGPCDRSGQTILRQALTPWERCLQEA